MIKFNLYSLSGKCNGGMFMLKLGTILAFIAATGLMALSMTAWWCGLPGSTYMTVVNKTNGPITYCAPYSSIVGERPSLGLVDINQQGTLAACSAKLSARSAGVVLCATSYGNLYLQYDTRVLTKAKSSCNFSYDNQNWTA